MDPNSLNSTDPLSPRRSFADQNTRPQVFRPTNSPVPTAQPVQFTPSTQPTQAASSMPAIPTTSESVQASMPALSPSTISPTAISNSDTPMPFGSYSMNAKAESSSQTTAPQTPLLPDYGNVGPVPSQQVYEQPPASTSAPQQSFQPSSQDAQQAFHPSIQPDIQPVNQMNNRPGNQFGYQPGSQPSNQPSNAYGQNPQFGQPVQPFQQMQRPKRKKRVLAIVIASIVVIGAAAGGVFGLYLPNTSANVWNTGLNRSGETLEQLTMEATAKDKVDVLKKSTLAGSIEFTSDGETYSGKINSKYDPISSDTTLSVSFKAPGLDTSFDSQGLGGSASQRPASNPAKQQEIGLQVLTEQAADKVFPDTFFKLSGFKTLGLDGFLPGLNDYDGKWIAAPAEYLQSFLPADELEKLQSEKKSGKTDSRFDHEDAAELARITMANSRKYLFSTDVETAILVQKSFVGTEELDGDITANHYTVSLNKANAKKFCQSIIDDLAASESFKKLPGMDEETFAEDKKTAIEDCKKSVDDDIDENDTFDMWIDKSYKLIHKVRFTDKEEKGSYVDIGQSYKGGDVLPLFMRVHSDKDKMDGTFTLDIDTKQNTTVGAWNFKATGEEAFSTKASLELKPHEGKVTITKPTGAIPLKDVLSRFGIDPADFAADSMPGASGIDEGDARIQEL